MFRFRKLFLISVLMMSMLLCACSTVAEASTKDERELRDNTPVVLEPQASGKEILEAEGLLIDISNSSEGYICVKYTGDSKCIKFFVITPDETKYTYDILPDDSFSILPLSGGNGTYTFDVRENVEDNLFSNLYKSEQEITLTNEFKPFLYPNQYTNFNKDSKVIEKTKELASGCFDELDVITAVYDYVIKNVKYDHEKAKNVEGGYLPDVDLTLETKTGICFDYAALMTAMLRSQGIPTKLEIGYSGEAYHAWISTYVAEKGWINNIVMFDGINWSLMDPTLASNNSSSTVKKYIGDGTHYVLKYSR